MPYLAGGAPFLRICRAGGAICRQPRRARSTIASAFFLRKFQVPVYCCSLVVCHSLLPSHPTPKSQPQLNFSQSQEVRFPFAETVRVSTPNTSWPMQLPLSVSRYLGLQVHVAVAPGRIVVPADATVCVCLCASHQRPGICGLYATVTQKRFLLVLVYFLFSTGLRSSSRPLLTSVCMLTGAYLPYYIHRVLHKHYLGIHSMLRPVSLHTQPLPDN